MGKPIDLAYIREQVEQCATRGCGEMHLPAHLETITFVLEGGTEVSREEQEEAARIVTRIHEILHEQKETRHG